MFTTPRRKTGLYPGKKDEDLKNPNHLKKAWSKTGISKIGRNENKRLTARMLYIFF